MLQKCHNVTMSPMSPMSQYHNVTMSQCHNITMSQCHNVTMSQCHNVTMSQCHNVVCMFPFWHVPRERTCKKNLKDSMIMMENDVLLIGLPSKIEFNEIWNYYPFNDRCSQYPCFMILFLNFICQLKCVTFITLITSLWHCHEAEGRIKGKLCKGMCKC